jgi:alkylation response protein AidB-like acyl-CoA dehydrogenase
MDFIFSDDQELFRDSVRRMLAARAGPKRLRENLDSASGLDAQLWRAAADIGSFSLLVGTEHGGGSLSDQGLVDAVVVAEEWGRALAPGPFISAQIVGHAISVAGSDEQRALLPKLVSGELLVSWCLAEAEGGWDPDRLRCQATSTEAGFEITGTKLHVEEALAADFFLVATLADGGTVAQLLVPADAAGLTVRPHVSMDLSRSTASVTFDRVAVPRSAVLPGSGAGLLRRLTQMACVLVCADSVGGAQRVLELTVDYAKQRTQFGRAIASFQAIKHRCADMLLVLESSRASTYYAAVAVHDQRDDAALATAIAKSRAGDGYEFVTGEGTQLHGGIAFTWEHDMHLFARRAKANQAMFGSSHRYRRQIWQSLASTAQRLALQDA